MLARALYHKLPPVLKTWVSKHVPTKYRRQSHLRNYGVINELYSWRVGEGIDTLVPIQNYFSVLFPGRDTSTQGQIWFFDKNGEQLASKMFVIPHNGMYLVRASEMVGGQDYGALMWHIRMPDTLASDKEISGNCVYFTDRGYICYEKEGIQPAFVHGIDRYAVFQKNELDNYELFYKEPSKRTWVAEFPILKGMQTKLDVLLINRSGFTSQNRLNLFQSGGKLIFSKTFTLLPRGSALLTLTEEEINQLDNQEGYFSVDGLPTPWGRPAIMRHFSCGSIAVMHC